MWPGHGDLLEIGHPSHLDTMRLCRRSCSWPGVHVAYRCMTILPIATDRVGNGPFTTPHRPAKNPLIETASDIIGCFLSFYEIT